MFDNRKMENKRKGKINIKVFNFYDFFYLNHEQKVSFFKYDDFYDCCFYITIFILIIVIVSK